MLLAHVAWNGQLIAVLGLILWVFFFFEYDFFEDFIGLCFERLEHNLRIHVHCGLRVGCVESVRVSIQMVLPGKGVLRKVGLDV